MTNARCKWVIMLPTGKLLTIVSRHDSRWRTRVFLGRDDAQMAALGLSGTVIPVSMDYDPTVDGLPPCARSHHPDRVCRDCGWHVTKQTRSAEDTP